MPSDQHTRGKRIQIYLAADLVERWEQTPRYERSAIVASALRQFWGVKNTEKNTNQSDRNDEDRNIPH